MDSALFWASYRFTTVLLLVLPVLQMLSFMRQMLKYADCLRRSAQRADVNSAFLFEVQSKLFV